MEKIRYKIGYLYRVFEEIGWEEVQLLKKCKEKCDKLIVGLVSDNFYQELMDKSPAKSFTEQQDILMLFKAVDEVIMIDKKNLSIKNSYEQIGYNCIFYGSEYGRQFEEDRVFLMQHNVEMVSLIPKQIINVDKDNFFLKTLGRAYDEGKIVLFGTGKYFDFYMQIYGTLYPPVYAVDNLKEKWNTSKQNILIQPPEVLKNENAENTLVIICCKEHKEIRQQILNMGIVDYRILRRDCAVAMLEEYASNMQTDKAFKRGYLLYEFTELDKESIQGLRVCKERCDKFMVGIPSDDLILRMTDGLPKRSFEDKKATLLHLQLADEVIEIDIDNINVRDSYQKQHYDVYFYGTEYGQQFQKDKKYLKEHNTALISVMPRKMQSTDGEDPVRRALQNAVSDRKVILFGTGKYFELYMQKYGTFFPPSYAVDNDTVLWGTKKSGVTIQNPITLKDENPENVMIVICCKNYKNILEQILKIGNFDYRTLLYNCNAALMEEYAVILQEEKEYMHKAHSILMKLMIEFDSVCKRYGLHYYVMGGSLIGVVRHKGLIPWDDDIDVAMFRKDYEILKEKANEIWNENPDFLFLDYDQLGNGAFYDFLTRLVYMKEELPTRLFKKVEGKARADIQNKLVMDIYVMENADNNEKKHKLVTNLMKAVYALAIGHRAKIDYSEYVFLPKPIYGLLQITFRVGHLIPLKFLFYLYEKLRGYAKNSNCDYVFESNNGAINYMPWRYHKKIYGNGKFLPMCDYEVMVPEDYDGLLKAKGYGDYMTLPPVNYRKPSHSAKARGIIW